MPNQTFRYIQQRCFNKPLLLEAGKARVISDYLEQRLGMGGHTLPPQSIEEGDHNHGDGMVFEERPMISGRVEGVVVIPIVGSLVNRSSNMDAASGITSHRSIRNEIIAAANDKSVKSILLDIDSGGGEVEGNFDLGRLIREVNDRVKPVVAIANGDAYSGAFSLGVSAGEFYMTETGGVGSVGVIIQHVDYSKANQAMGIKVTNIKFGDDKDIFSSDSPLSAEAKSILQEEVNRTGEMFITHVASMRGISKKSVISTKAGLLFGQKAVNINFVDGITSFDELLEDMINSDFATGTIENERTSRMFLRDKKASTPSPTKSSEVEEAPAVVEVAAVEVAQDLEPEVATPEIVEAPTQEVSDDPVERAATISAMCAESGMFDMAPSFIRSNMTIDQLKEKIDTNTQINQACKLAGKPDRAAKFISAGTSISEVQSTLISEQAEEQDGNEVSAQQDPEVMKADLEKAKASSNNVILADAKKRQEKANKGVR